MIIQNKKILTSILLILISFVSVGAAQDEPPVPQAKGPPGPPGFPIDDNLIILVAVAIIYGAYISFKLLKKRTQV